jgi:hypothetical protein
MRAVCIQAPVRPAGTPASGGWCYQGPDFVQCALDPRTEAPHPPTLPFTHTHTSCFPFATGARTSSPSKQQLPELISHETIISLEAELDNGSSIAALRRFSDNLRNLPADQWGECGWQRGACTHMGSKFVHAHCQNGCKGRGRRVGAVILACRRLNRMQKQPPSSTCTHAVKRLQG